MDNIWTTFLLHTNCIHGIHNLNISITSTYIQITHHLHTDYMQITYRLHTDYIQITYRLHMVHIVNIYRDNTTYTTFTTSDTIYYIY
jgi:hypothetical protein